MKEKMQPHSLPLLASKLLNTPLMLLPGKADILVSLLSERMGLAWQPGTMGMFDDDFEEFGDVREKRPFDVQNGKAIIPVIGTLTDLSTNLDSFSGLRSYASIQRDMEQAAASEDVREQVLFIHSPGGTCTGLFEFIDWVRLMSEDMKITAWVHGMATSAAFGIAAACSRLVVSQNAVLGSVGTIFLHADMSQREALQGVKVTALFAGDRKNDGSPHEPLTDGAQQAIMSHVNAMNDIFITKIAQFRGMTSGTVRDTEAGIFVGQEAIDIGFADEIGTFQGVIDTPLTEERSFFMTMNTETVTAGKHVASVLNGVLTERESRGERRVDLMSALQLATGLSNKGVGALFSNTVLEGLPTEYIQKITDALNIDATSLERAARLDAGEPEPEPEPEPAPVSPLVIAPAPIPDPTAPVASGAMPEPIMRSQEAVATMVAAAVAQERERISGIYTSAMKGGMSALFVECAFASPVSQQEAVGRMYEESMDRKATARTEFSADFLRALDLPAPAGPGGELPSAESQQTEVGVVAAWVNNTRAKGARSKSEHV